MSQPVNGQPIKPLVFRSHLTTINDLIDCAESWDVDARLLGNVTAGRMALSLRAVLNVIDAASCIHHWHDRGDDGMVVSAEHVHLLWAELAEFKKARDE
jgi:hypothetical protein